ncbi:M23 family metallopeptidase [Arthrobacter sp. I2-34]|uniref:M23 family metallopeptidase n=1 Tax=Arthrobacter hankyongi TaxID=2904801 RepID=A0ABS9L2S5_9MICC|nr:M23 family metallopeptidase [Arthrobacter hankyongi]MCG2620971.1 M23 family metallopeptidase [Arthrobacter hankyongi]
MPTHHSVRGSVRGRRAADRSLSPSSASQERSGRQPSGRRRAEKPASPLGRLGKFAGLAAAAAGMVAAAALPTAPAGTSAAAGGLSDSAARAAAVSRVDVHVAAEQKLDFNRSSVTSKAPAVKMAPGARLAAPVQKMHTSSGFGHRINPVTGAPGEFHNGLDFAHPCGTPVTAAKAGKVVEASSSAYGYGNRIVVDHGDGVETTYNHLQSKGVRTGQQVAQGQKIAALGTTGNSTGCHLHFEVMVKGKAVDPKGWL